MKSGSFCYVILHYLAMEETIKAVESVDRMDKHHNRAIVIIDNGSSDGSGESLRQRYCKREDITVIIREKNEGFAKGNNIGYSYAREVAQADFVVVINNDVEFLQKDFEDRVVKIYEEKHFHVLGPDILTPQGEHSNPHRQTPLSKSDIRRIIRNRSIILLYVKVKEMLGLTDKIQVIERLDEKRTQAERDSVNRDYKQTDVVLQGSCLIFSSDYTFNEKWAFCPDTFLYLEEDILENYCRQKNYCMMYAPEISILHKEEQATRMDATDESNHLYNYSFRLRESARVMKRVMK